MKSTEVYKAIHAIVGPWCRQNGFTKMKSGWLAYQKPCAGKYLSFWFQCDRWGWDKYSGSRFTVEFQLHASSELGQLSNERLPHFLTPEELEFVRARQNRIIGKIPPPPSEWVELFENNARRQSRTPEMLIEGFWLPWKLVERPYQSNDDIWMRYWQEEDVNAWALFVVSLLPRVIAQLMQDHRA